MLVVLYIFEYFGSLFVPSQYGIVVRSTDFCHEDRGSIPVGGIFLLRNRQSVIQNYLAAPSSGLNW